MVVNCRRVITLIVNMSLQHQSRWVFWETFVVSSNIVPIMADLLILWCCRKCHIRPHLPTSTKKKDTTSSFVSQSNPFSLFIFDQQGQLWAELPHHQNLWQMPTNLSNCHNFWLPNAQCPALILFEKSFPNHEKLYQCSGSHDYLV